MAIPLILVLWGHAKGFSWAVFGFLPIDFDCDYATVKTAPSESPRRWSLATDAAGGNTYYHYITVSDKTQSYNEEKTGGSKMKTREEMLEYIYGQLENATDLEVEQYYWFFFDEE